MSKFISQETVISALDTLMRLNLRRTGRTAATGFLLLKAKEPDPGTAMIISSQGPTSVEPEIREFLRVAPGTPAPDVNPFGKQENRLEYLAEGYERRGTYTHLYEGRNLSSFLNVEPTDRAFRVEIPDTAAAEVAEKLGRKLPLEPTAAFFMRHHEFADDAGSAQVADAFVTRFHLSATERSALFESDTHFPIKCSDAPHVDRLTSLPPHLQPRAPSSTHAATARAGREVVPLSNAQDLDLVVDKTLQRRIERAIARTKAVALVGPPGTAKSSLLVNMLESAGAEPSTIGLKRGPKYLSVTAEVDWTARTIIGGYYPQEDGALVFREGFLLQAIKNDQILLIDEMNRADLDRVLGPVLTFLTGQPVDLGMTHLGSETGENKSKKMVLVWSTTVESGMREDEEQRVYYAGTDWRLLGTYNNVDRGRVFPMGSALQRRWALIPVPPISAPLARNVFGQAEVRPAVAEMLTSAYEMHLQYLAIGLAPFLEIARYVGIEDDVDETAAVTSEELELLQDGYVLFMGQQLTRLDPEQRKEFLDELGTLFGAGLVAEVGQL